jgi:gliding motility-associated-like protein
MDGLEDQPSLAAGTYHLIVTDLNNCETTTDITLTQPDPVIINFTVTDITCQVSAFDNGSVDLTVSGGISPYAFVWSNGMSSEDITGLTEGYYRVTVTDSNGCSKTDSVRVNLPPPLIYSKTISDYNGYQISCNGMSDGFIRIDPTNGEPPFLYSWSGPDGFSSASNYISVLIAGQYVLTITDNNYCTATDTFALVEPEVLGIGAILSASSDGGYNINCAGTLSGSIEIVPLNAAGSIEYLWSDGISGRTREGLAAGDYKVIISDGNNCHADTTLTLSEPDSLKVTYQITQPFCPDKPDGLIILNVTGGVAGTGYTYEWSDNSTGSILTNVPSGKYSVIVTDLNRCAVTSSIKVEAVNQTCLQIPDAISPDGDGINDFWNIGLIELYPEVEITIYNRWSESIWKSARGYPKPWDGRSNGADLPIDSYHYIIDLHNGSKPIIGNVTIVR